MEKMLARLCRTAARGWRTSRELLASPMRGAGRDCKNVLCRCKAGCFALYVRLLRKRGVGSRRQRLGADLETTGLAFSLFQSPEAIFLSLTALRSKEKARGKRKRCFRFPTPKERDKHMARTATKKHVETVVASNTNAG
jgi:hypothetical protein